MNKVTLIIPAVSLLLFSFNISAATLSGQITYFNFVSAYQTLDNPNNVGVGSYFEVEIGDDPQYDGWSYPDVKAPFSFTSNGERFSPAFSGFNVINDGIDGDSLVLTTLDPSSGSSSLPPYLGVSGHDYMGMTITLFDTSATVFSSAELPTILDLSSFDRFTVSIELYEYRMDHLTILGEGNISEVPVPPAILLFVTGFLSLFGIAFRKK